MPAAPSGPFNIVSTGYTTEEDFDLHPDGWLMSQYGSSLQGLNAQGEIEIFTTGLGGDVAGLRVLTTLDIAVAQPDLGTLMMVDATGGNNATVVTGLQTPNGLATDKRGFVYIAEWRTNGRVMQFDPYGSNPNPTVLLDNLARPNGLAMSPDENTLYIAEDNEDRIIQMTRTSDWDWGPPSLFWNFPQAASYLALTTDYCGNLYTVNYSTGEVYRMRADGSGAEPIADIDDFGSYSAMHFGNGSDGWPRTTLYITRRSEMYGIDVGVPGRDPVYPPSP